MEQPTPYFRHDNLGIRFHAWRWVVGAAFVIFFFNTLAFQWGHPEVFGYEVPSRDALIEGRYWTLLTYPLATTDWFLGPLSIFFMFVAAQAAWEYLNSPRFFALCSLCALAGAVAWLPLHWSGGEQLAAGPTVLALGLLSFWMFAIPDEPVEVRLFFSIPVTVRLRVFFWLVLALETGAFITLELLQVTGISTMFPTGIFNSAQLGAMGAGCAFALWLKNAPQPNAWMDLAPEEEAPRRRMQKPVHVGVAHAEADTEGAAPKTFKAHNASPSELRAELDRILDKINTHGLDNLSPDERSTLENARKRLK